MFSNNFDKRFRKQSLPPPQAYPCILHRYFLDVETILNEYYNLLNTKLFTCLH